MSSVIRVVNGTYRNEPVKGQIFTLVKGYQTGKKGGFVTVKNEGQFPNRPAEVRVQIINQDQIQFLAGKPEAEPVVATPTETDEQAMDRIATRFRVLDEMSKATISGDIRAMIVTGPPGVGKSHGVTLQMEKASMFDKLASRKVRFEVVKGAMSAIGLYCKLFSFADSGNVLVFDDCDSILLDDLSLNILKAALDSSKKRYISWNTDSSMLRREGVPDRFEFKGSVIFITNIKFEHVRSQKLKDHLDALESRCHYLDLTMDTVRDKMLRIKQIIADGMLDKYDFTDEEKDAIVAWVWEKKDQLREISLRTVLKVADLAKMKPIGWERLAETTVIKRHA